MGESEGCENTDSKFCGVETDFSDDVPSLLDFNTVHGRFDFVLAPLVCILFESFSSVPILVH